MRSSSFGHPGKPRCGAAVNIADALVLVLCFPVAGALLFTLAAIEQRLTGEPTRRQRRTAQAGPAQAGPDERPVPGAKPDNRGSTDLSNAA